MLKMIFECSYRLTNCNYRSRRASLFSCRMERFITHFCLSTQSTNMALYGTRHPPYSTIISHPQNRQYLVRASHRRDASSPDSISLGNRPISYLYQLSRWNQPHHFQYPITSCYLPPNDHCLSYWNSPHFSRLILSLPRLQNSSLIFWACPHFCQSSC